MNYKKSHLGCKSGVHIVCLLLFTISILKGQSKFLFEHYSLEQGLSQGSGYAVAQYDNFMWMGTQDGVNRFDGYNFKVFRSDDVKGVNDNFIQGFLHDSQNRFWVATIKGICLYDKANESFEKLDDYFKIKHVLNKVSVRKITEDRAGNIWFITDENGIFCFNSKTKQFQSYFDKANNFIELDKSPDGKLWLLSDEDVYLFDVQLARFIPQNIKKVLGFTNKNVLRAISTDKQSNLWLGTYEDGIYVLSPQRKLLKHYTKGDDSQSLSSNEIKCFLRDSENRIWVGTRNAGISLYLPDKDEFAKIIHNQTDSKSLAKNYVLSFFEDRQSNIWVGLSGGGFDKFDPRKYHFQIIEHNPEKPTNSLSDNMVFKIMGHKNYLYIGTQAGGLARMDTLSHAFQIYRPIKNDPRSILHSEVYDISTDTQKNLWLATGRGLCAFNTEKQIFQSYLQQGTESSLYLFAVKVLHNQTELWAGGQRGIFRFDLVKKQWKTWRDLPEMDKISNYVIRVIFEDSQQNIWFGTLGHGLIRYSFKTKKVDIFDDKVGLKCANIRSMYEDNTHLWVGTDCGLFKFKKDQMSLENHFSIKNGLSNNVIYGIIQDLDNHLWLSSNRGLMKFSKEKGLLKSYRQSEGLSSNEFNTNCTYKSPGGTLYFGSIAGITHFNPKKLRSNDFSPQVRITQIKVLDSLYNPNIPELQLNYLQNFIDIDYSTFNFSNTESNTYQHQLLGIDEDWIDGGTSHSAHYTNLPPGEFIFKVQSKNADGIESKLETNLHIRIKPPFWATRWFKTLLLGTLICVLYIVFRNRVNQIRKEGERKNELNHIRSQAEMIAMKAQINPHFIFNCLNTVDAYILTNKKKEASHFLQMFSKLVRNVLESSSEELISVGRDLETLKLYTSLEEERFENKFKTAYVLEDDDIKSLQIPPLLLQPFVENAILHGIRHLENLNGSITIALQMDDSLLRIEITDTGVGRIASKELNKNRLNYHESKGIQLTINRIVAFGELYNQKSSYEIVDLPQGTQIIIKIPAIKTIHHDNGHIDR
ncbi:MAG: ligand-binding sensor domain-containing protein [Leadbetterella sp.]